MSGTSLDGIDFAFLETNGTNYVNKLLSKSYEYSDNYKLKIKRFIKKLQKNNALKVHEMDLFVSKKFLKMTKIFINEFKIDISVVDYIGLSGQTVLHKPEKKISIQLGSGKFLSKYLNIKVIGNFRQNDISMGGQGAPIGAFYNQYLSKKLNQKIVFINLGGIANICYCNNKKLIAFDTGPGNALIDDFIWKRIKQKFDKNGKLSNKGKLNKNILNIFLKNNYFKKKYPKSLDRNDFNHYLKLINKLSNKDGAHTLSLLTVYSIKKGIEILNEKIDKIILTGGGRKNLFIYKNLKKILKYKIINIDELGLDGDLLEAEAFAYIAIRSIKKLPLSLKTTTGVQKPISGGIVYNN